MDESKTMREHPENQDSWQSAGCSVTMAQEGDMIILTVLKKGGERGKAVFRIKGTEPSKIKDEMGSLINPGSSYEEVTKDLEQQFPNTKA